VTSSDFPNRPADPSERKTANVEAPQDEHALAVVPAGEHHVPVHASPGTGKRILVGVLVLAVGLAATWFIVSHRKAEAESSLQRDTQEAVDAPPPVNVVSVEYGPSSHTLSLPGEAKAWYESTIYARVSGYVEKWNVDIGDQVKAGQVLATIETPELDQQLAAAKAKVEASDAQINLAKANMHFSEVTLDRYKDAPKGVVSELERDERSSDAQTSSARVMAAISDLQSSKADVDRLEAMIAFQKVTAPFDGTITDRRVDVGDLVTAGSTASTTSLYRIAQMTKLRIYVDVPQSAALAIRDGDEATATWNGHDVEGKVARNAKTIDVISKTLRVEVDIPNENSTLLPGMYLDVEFKLHDAKPSLQVPASAMYFRTGGPEVAVVSADGHVMFHEVTIVRDMGNIVEVSGGISVGDRVALNISNQVVDGDVVSATEAHSDGASPDSRPEATATRSAVAAQ
jgi:RND family efflux transporter MFP subunit